MLNEFIYKYLNMSRSGSYMRSPGALYKKLNLLGEICFDLITFCQDERTCVRYLSEFLYPNYEIFGSYLAPFCKGFVIFLISHIWKCIQNKSNHRGMSFSYFCQIEIYLKFDFSMRGMWTQYSFFWASWNS